MRAASLPECHGVLAFNDPRVDGCLSDGGLPLGQLHEVATEGVGSETGAVLAGFVACLLARLLARPSSRARPVFWISTVSDLHAPGLLAYGLDPGRLILVHTTRDTETLEAMEACLRGGAAAAVVGEVGRLGRTPSRRLQLACQRRGTTGFALRRWPWGRDADRREAACEGSVAATRWRVLAVPGNAADGVPGPPRWEVMLTHARGGLEGAWIMELAEQGATDATNPLLVVAELADAAPAPARNTAAIAG